MNTPATKQESPVPNVTQHGSRSRAALIREQLREPRVIDLSGGPDDDHSHARGKIAVGHVGGRAALSQRQAVIFEFIEARGHLDLHCPDCASTVTALAGAPGCVAAAVAVRHQEPCPRLRKMLAQGGGRP